MSRSWRPRSFCTLLRRMASKIRLRAPDRGAAPEPPSLHVSHAEQRAPGVPPVSTGELVTNDMMLALRERFRAGCPDDSGEHWDTSRPPLQRVPITVARLKLPLVSDASLLVADGSASCYGSRTGAAAAVAADGRVLIAWYQHDRDLSGQFAEFQAIRLALRLASRYGRSRVFSDCEPLCEKLNDARTSRARIARMIGCNDPEAIGEVMAGLREQAVAVRWMGRLNPGHVGSHPLLVQAHRLAWAARRMVCDGIDPGAELAWLTSFAQLPGRNQASIRASYETWLSRRTAMECPPAAS